MFVVHEPENTHASMGRGTLSVSISVKCSASNPGGCVSGPSPRPLPKRAGTIPLCFG